MKKIAGIKKSLNTKAKIKSSRGCQPASKLKAETLEELIEEYLEFQKKRPIEKHNPIRSMLEGYRDLSSLEEAIEVASMALDLVGKRYDDGSQSNNLRMNSHQWRLKKSDLTKGKRKLLAKKTAIKAATSFEDIYKVVLAVSNGIKGLGILYAYDTALRIGAYLKKYPQKVYLQAGALTGARALNLKSELSPLAKKDFPKPLHKLKAYEIEDFLCIYKKNIQIQ